MDVVALAASVQQRLVLDTRNALVRADGEAAGFEVLVLGAAHAR